MDGSNPKNVQILAFVCDEETRATIAAFGETHPHITLEAHVGGVKEAVRYLSSNRSPRVLIIDLSQSTLPISDVQKLTEVCEPGVDVLTMGTRNDVGIFRDVIKLGAKDYIAKPITLDFLQRSLEGMGIESGNEGREQVSGFMGRGQIIAFIGARGGVGTSTAAANVAWILAEERHRHVSLVDLNLHLGTLARQFNLAPTNSLHQALESADLVDEMFVERASNKYSDHLSILASEEPLNHKVDISVEALNRLLSILTQRFHYSIVDLPLCFDHPLNEIILEKARIIVIVADLTLFSVRDTARLLTYCNEQKSTHQRQFVLVNRVGEYKAGTIDEETFEKSIQKKIEVAIPFDATHSLEAINIGQPIASLNSPSTVAYRKFVERLVGSAHHTAPENQGLLKSLLRKFKS